MRYVILNYILIFLFFSGCCYISSDLESCYEISQGNKYIDSLQIINITPQQDSILKSFEDSKLVFKKFETDSLIYYSHQRRVGDVIIEKDSKRYIYNKLKDSLVFKKVSWRDELPDLSYSNLPLSKVRKYINGEIQLVNLYLISPESNIFKIIPLPTKPCWAIWSKTNGHIQITVLDGQSGEKLGMGIPPPFESKGLSISGPTPLDDETLCEDPWNDWYESAAVAFNVMGYSPSLTREFPSRDYLRENIRSDNIALFYEIAHGDFTYFRNGCPETTTARNIETWLSRYSNIPFVFIASCGGLCSTADNTFANEFSKNLSVDAAIVGYCHMNRSWCNGDCWDVSVEWQDEFFRWLMQGYTVFQSFTITRMIYPECNNCIHFYGDRFLRLVPKLKRSINGLAEDNLETDIYNVHVGPLVNRSRRNYIRNYVKVANDKTLTIHLGARLVFIDNALMYSEGDTNIDGRNGDVQFFTENDTRMKCKGVIKLQNGGSIRIYDR
jgi:hypothetical protein